MTHGESRNIPDEWVGNGPASGGRNGGSISPFGTASRLPGIKGVSRLPRIRSCTAPRRPSPPGDRHCGMQTHKPYVHFADASSDDAATRDRKARASMLRILSFAGVVSFILSSAVGSILPHPGIPFWPYPLFGTPLGTSVVWLGVYWFPRASSEGFLSFLWPNRGEAPRQASYSHIEAMAAAGDIPGALGAYERVIAADPVAIVPRAQAAELYARGSDTARAAALFAEIRRIPGCSPQNDLYATQRLIDLYDGPLDQPAKSLTELRRIVERHRDSREAPFARAALVRRKRESS